MFHFVPPYTSVIYWVAKKPKLRRMICTCLEGLLFLQVLQRLFYLGLMLGKELFPRTLDEKIAQYPS